MANFDELTKAFLTTKAIRSLIVLVVSLLVGALPALAVETTGVPGSPTPDGAAPDGQRDTGRLPWLAFFFLRSI